MRRRIEPLAGVERGVPDERHKGAAADLLSAYLAEASRARSHASHHIFMISKGTTAQNRYGIGTSNCTCGAFGHSAAAGSAHRLLSHITAIERAAGLPVPAAKTVADFVINPCAATAKLSQCASCF